MPLNNFGAVTPHLTRSAQPADLDAFDTLAKLNVTIIYKLNSDTEFPVDKELQWASDCNMQLQVDDSISIFKPNIAKLKKTAEQIWSLIQQGEIVHVHCSHGRDRTGTVIAAIRILYEHWGVKEALEEMKAYGVQGVIELGDHELIKVLKKLKGE